MTPSTAPVKTERSILFMAIVTAQICVERAVVFGYENGVVVPGQHRP
jgi:hypothetical protein